MEKNISAPFARKNTRYKTDFSNSLLMYGRTPKNADFTCRNCGRFVSADLRLAGVNNRNHCPYCLCSKHVDLTYAGDRLAACKAVMRPIGLTIKRSGKKYAPSGLGEVMLVHHCSDCAKISINRIAADDDESRMREVFQNSLGLDEYKMEKLENMGIELVTSLEEIGLWSTLISPIRINLKEI